MISDVCLLITTTQFHIAEFNIARLKAQLDSPEIKEFVDFLEPVNHFAEQSKGFVWRLASENGGASSYLAPAFSDPLIVTNLTVWEDIESLKEFTYQTVHTYFLRSHKKWFEQATQHQVAMWWVKQNQLPTLEEAKEKLNHLNIHGATSQTFTFQSLFDSEGNALKNERKL